MSFGVGQGTRSGLGRGVAAVALAAVAVVGGAGAASALSVEGANGASTSQEAPGSGVAAGQRPDGATQRQSGAEQQGSPPSGVAGDSRWLVFNETSSDISLYDSSKWTTGNYYWTLPSGWTHAGQDSQWGTDLTTWIKFGDGTKVDMKFENAAVGWPKPATVDGDSHNFAALERKSYNIKGHTIEIMRNVDTSDGAKDFYVYVKS